LRLLAGATHAHVYTLCPVAVGLDGLREDERVD
jgi:hypothetical protein